MPNASKKKSKKAKQRRAGQGGLNQQKEVTFEQRVKITSERVHLVFSPKKPKLEMGKWMNSPEEAGLLLVQQKSDFQLDCKYTSETKTKETESVNP